MGCCVSSDAVAEPAPANYVQQEVVPLLGHPQHVLTAPFRVQKCGVLGLQVARLITSCITRHTALNATDLACAEAAQARAQAAAKRGLPNGGPSSATATAGGISMRHLLMYRIKIFGRMCVLLMFDPCFRSAFVYILRRARLAKLKPTHNPVFY